MEEIGNVRTKIGNRDFPRLAAILRTSLAFKVDGDRISIGGIHIGDPGLTLRELGEFRRSKFPESEVRRWICRQTRSTDGSLEDGYTIADSLDHLECCLIHYENRKK